MKLIQTEVEWRKHCEENGWKIEDCTCHNAPNCPRIDKLCHTLNAVDDSGISKASFKCGVPYGKIF